MRITLNLATRAFTDLGPAIKRLRIAIGALAAMALLLGLGLHAFHQKAEEARAREHDLDEKIAAITQDRQSYENLMRQPDNAEVLAHAGALNQLFDEKDFSWTLAMEDLERVLPGGVQVSTLEPIRAKDGTITLHLRVIGPRDRAVELVQNLEHSRRFLLPRIVGENSESSGGPGEKLEPISASSRVNFDLLAEYNPASPGEPRPVRKGEKPSPDGEATVRPAAPHTAHPAPVVTINPAQQATRPPYTGVSRPPAVTRSKPNAGGPK
jgi:type IV pilus assembly protein PilN